MVKGKILKDMLTNYFLLTSKTHGFQYIPGACALLLSDLFSLSSLP